MVRDKGQAGAKTRGLVDVRDLLVPTDGSRASMEAVALASAVAKRNKGNVHIVHVIEVARGLPLDADLTIEAEQGARYLSEAEHVAERMDAPHVDTALLQAREACHAIVDEATNRNVDAIVLGIEYREPFGQFEVGRTTAFVLRNAPCQVWVHRLAARE